MPIRAKYELELEKLKVKLILMAKSVNHQIESSVESLIHKDVELARKVVIADDIIDDYEEEIEGICLKILLTQQPVATDFREVSSILKVITDLERIGDQAEDIANIVIDLMNTNYERKLVHIPAMTKIAVEMVSDSIRSYVSADLDLAKLVIKKDDVMDDLYTTVKSELVDEIKTGICDADVALSLLIVAKYLERIGDHSVNICEWAEYYKTGEHKK